MRIAYKEMTIPQLRTFLEVCRVHSFASAARRMSLSTGTAWEQVRSLERNLGRLLVVRRGREVEPTPEGLRLSNMLEPVLTALDSIQTVLQQESGLIPATIRIIGGTRMLLEEVTPILAGFQKRYPGVRLQIFHAGVEHVEPLVASRQADLAITLEPDLAARSSASVDYELAYETDYYLVTPPGHPLLTKHPLHLRDILTYPLVLRRPGAYARLRVEGVFVRHNLGEEMRIAVETSTGALSLACIRAGLGIGLIAGSPSSSLFRTLGLRNARHWFGTARTVFVWRRGAYHPPLCRELARIIRDGVQSGLKD